MILERVEKDELVKAIYESSNIVASTYNRGNKNLNIVFKNGGSYTYQNVPETDYVRFETAESQGQVLNSQIKKYAFLKHDNVETDEVVKKIKAIIREENKAMEVGLSELMKEASSEFDTMGTFNSQTIDKLNNMLSVYNNISK